MTTHWRHPFGTITVTLLFSACSLELPSMAVVLDGAARDLGVTEAGFDVSADGHQQDRGRSDQHADSVIVDGLADTLPNHDATVDQVISAAARVKSAAPPGFKEQSNTWTAVPGARVAFTPSHSDENWLVLMSGSLAVSGAVRLTVNGHVRAHGVFHGVSGQGLRPLQAITLVTAQSTEQVVLVEQKGGSTSDLSMIAMPLPAAADVHHVRLDNKVLPEKVLTKVPLSFTPAYAGDYLLLASWQMDEAPGSATVTGRLSGPAQTPWPDMPFRNPGSNRPTMHVVGRVFPLRDNATQFDLEFTSAISKGSMATNIDLIALRIDSFHGFKQKADLPKVTLTAPTPPLALGLGGLQTRPTLLWRCTSVFGVDFGRGVQVDFQDSGTAIRTVKWFQDSNATTESVCHFSYHPDILPADAFGLTTEPYLAKDGEDVRVAERSIYAFSLAP